MIKIALLLGRVSIFYSVSFQLRSRARNGDCFIIALMRSVVRLFNFVARFNGDPRNATRVQYPRAARNVSTSLINRGMKYI